MSLSNNKILQILVEFSYKSNFYLNSFLKEFIKSYIRFLSLTLFE
ncbi:hypothetical protein LEP1GSC007_3803 [Leptospira interrogans serovar Bulgarica str. Mallika]|nr:hypothetical protein LEP1GSC007_3803 [Leptospira interrogans serovar Bulgarica str. Mallika]